MKSTQSSSKKKDKNGKLSSSSYKCKTKEESVVDVSNSVCSGPVLDVDNNEHQSIEVELNKEKRDDKGR